MSIEKGDATKYVHTGNGELCYELNKALTVPETFPIYLSSAYIFDSIDPIDKICDEGAPGYAYFRLGNHFFFICYSLKLYPTYNFKYYAKNYYIWHNKIIN